MGEMQEGMNVKKANALVPPPTRCDESSSPTRGDESSSSSSETDRNAKLLFLRLEPVVRSLLEAIRRYKTLLCQQERNNDTLLLEQTASLLRKEYGLVGELCDILRTMGSSEYHYSLSKNQVSGCLIMFADYLFFPLMAILQSTSLQWSFNNDDDDDNGDGVKANLDAVVHSNSFKCVERASSTLVVLLDILGPQFIISHEAKLKLLASCASALPTGEEIIAEGFTTDNAALLEHCLQHLLTLLGSILQLRSDENERFSRSQLPRIVDCLAALVRPIPRSGGNGDDSIRAAGRQVSKEIRVLALNVLEMLLNRVNEPSLWRVFFPVLFVGLYRSALQSLRVSMQSSRVTVHSVRVLSRLLRMTWYKEDHHNSSLVGSKLAKAAIMDRIQSLASNSGKNISTDDGTGPSSDESTGDSAFYQQADKRIPGPLSLLIHLLSTARTPTIRLQASFINSVVLGKAEITTDNGELKKLMTTAFESCLLLSQDEDDEVKSAASNVLEESMSSTSIGRDVTVFVGPRILYLVEELLPLSQARRDTELQTSLKLISAYLQIESSQTDTRKKLREFLVEENTMHSIKDVFAKLLDMRFDPLGIQKGELDFEIVRQGSILEMESPSPPLKYFGTETLRCVQSTVECLAKILGSKQTTLLIDSCIADLYEASVSRVQQGLPLTGPSQLNWVYSWIGLIKFSLYLLSGSFSPKYYPDAKVNRRKYLKSLASSAVPLITSYPLWKLHVPGSNNNPEVPLVVQANEEMTVYLLELVESMFEALGDDAVDSLPTILYPVVEKAASVNSRISDRGMSILEYFSQCSSCRDLKSLFTRNIGLLTSSMMNRLRIPGGQSVTATTSNDVHEDMMEVARVASLVFRVIGEKRGSPDVMESRKDEDFIFSCMDELARKFIHLFDRLTTKTISDESVSIAFLQLFDAIADILTSKSIQMGVGSNITEEKLHEVLDSFRIDRATKGFAKYHERKSGKFLNPVKEDGIDMSLFRRGTSLASTLVPRCGYLLSHRSLFVQVRSCEVLNRLFQYLGQVALAIPSDDGEANGPRTAVLRTTHDLWPSISSKLKTLSDEVTVPVQISLLLMKSPNLLVDGSTNTAQKRVYFSKLLELSATMAECSDDFMEFRFRGDIWPCIRKILSSFLSRGDLGRGAKLSSSEQHLLLALINCLGRYFAHHPTGIALADLIPSVGALLLPFLRSGSDEIVTQCTEAFQHMLQIDCDSLWRQLVAFSEQDLPPCPLLVSSQALIPKATQEGCMGGSSMLVVEQLLSFADNLPEKPF